MVTGPILGHTGCDFLNKRKRLQKLKCTLCKGHFTFLQSFDFS
jgi:hypothetical protein